MNWFAAAVVLVLGYILAFAIDFIPITANWYQRARTYIVITIVALILLFLPHW